MKVWTWFRRLFKLLLVSVLLAYLMINSLLNLPLVRRQLHSYLEENIGRPVTMGYIYLDWQLNPSLSYLGVGEEEYRSPERAGTVILEHISLDVRWSYLREAYDRSQPVLVLEKVKIYRLTVNDEPGHEAREVTPEFPEIDVFVERWQYNIAVDDRGSFQVAGRDLRYSSPEKPLQFEISRVGGRPAAGRGELTLFPRAALELQLDYFQLAEEFWGGFDSAWRGEMRFEVQESDLSRLELNVEGLPGQFRDFNLPPASVDLSLALLPDKFRLEQLDVDSNYFTGDLAGEVMRTGEIVALGGDFKLYPGHIFGWLNTIQQEIEFAVQQTADFSGSFQLEGNIFSPQPSGEISFPGANITLSRDEKLYPLEITDWLASFQKEGLHWQQGAVKMDGLEFNLSGGMTGREDEVFTTTLTGMLSGEDFGAGLFPQMVVERVGLGQSLLIPTNLTFGIDRQGIQASFLARDGDIAFPDKDFEDIWLFASYSSFAPASYTVNGRFSGPDGNNWEITGEDNQPLEFSSQIENLDYWIDTFFERPQFMAREVGLRGTEFSMQFNSPFVDWMDLEGRLNFTDGRLFFLDDQSGLTELQGQIRLHPEFVIFDGVEGWSQRGSFLVEGSITHRDWFTEGDMELEFRGDNFYSRDFFPEGSRVEFENLDFSGVLTGTLEAPRFTGDLSAGEITVGTLQFLDLQGEFDHQPEGFSFTLEETGLGGGELSGQFSGSKLAEVQVDLRARGLQPDVLFHQNDYIRDNVRGTLGLTAELTGDLTDWESWSGEVELEHSELHLIDFPDVTGIHRVADLQVIGRNIDIRADNYRFPVEGGIIRVRNLILNAPAQNMELAVRGNIGLDGNLDLRQDLILRGEALRSYLQDLIGDVFRGLGLSPEREFVIRFYLRGTVQEPEFEFDAEHARRGLQQDFISSFISERLGRPISRILNRLF